MFSQETPELWFKVLEVSFEEQKIFSELTRFRCTLIKLKPSHLEVVTQPSHLEASTYGPSTTIYWDEESLALKFWCF